MIAGAVNVLVMTFLKERKLLLCGNGGSASDCEHIAAELLKNFELTRQKTEKQQRDLTPFTEDDIGSLQVGYPAIPLPSLTSALTAYSNDQRFDLAFAQLVFSLGELGDALWVISTSGESKNVLYAIEMAKARNLKVILLIGESSSYFETTCDAVVEVGGSKTAEIQELQVKAYHEICRRVEKEMEDLKKGEQKE